MKDSFLARRLIKYVLALGIMSSSMITPTFAQTDVHILDVGQGLSVLIESQGKYLLYDGGDRDKSSFVVSYLKQQEVSQIDYMIASHYDSDHLNGLVGALNTINVKQIFAPNYTTDTRVFESFQHTVASKNIPKEQPKVGKTYPLGDASIQIISPSGTEYSDVNDYSIGIRIIDGNNSFLITGDAEAKSESEICRTGLSLDSDVYVMGHHGSGTSSSWDLLQKSTPEYAVLSCGTGNPYGHPHIESMEKLQVMEIDLFRTDKQGTIIASTDGKTITWNVDPCNDYSPGDSNDLPVQVQSQSGSQSSNETSQTVSVTTEYILNTSSKKIHFPNCKSVSQMKEKNKKATSESKTSLLAQGYTPCGNCKP